MSKVYGVEELFPHKITTIILRLEKKKSGAIPIKSDVWKLGMVRDYYYQVTHDDVIKWKHFPRYLPFVWGIRRWPVNSPHTKANDAELYFFLWSVPE